MANKQLSRNKKNHASINLKEKATIPLFFYVRATTENIAFEDDWRQVMSIFLRTVLRQAIKLMQIESAESAKRTSWQTYSIRFHLIFENFEIPILHTRDRRVETINKITAIERSDFVGHFFLRLGDQLSIFFQGINKSAETAVRFHVFAFEARA